MNDDVCLTGAEMLVQVTPRESPRLTLETQYQIQSFTSEPLGDADVWMRKSEADKVL